MSVNRWRTCPCSQVIGGVGGGDLLPSLKRTYALKIEVEEESSFFLHAGLKSHKRAITLFHCRKVGFLGSSVYSLEC